MHHIQPTFAGGEFAPSLHSRVDIAKYSIGLRTAKNFIIHPHGGASNRPGTRMASEVKTSTSKIRTIPFEFSTEQSYVIEFGDYYCRFYKDGALILWTGTAAAYGAGTAYSVNDYVTAADLIYRCIQAGTGHTPASSPTYWTLMSSDPETIPYEISTPYAAADLPYLRYTQAADVLYITHPDIQQQTLTRFDHDDWEMEYLEILTGPFMPSNIDEAFTLNVSAVSGTGKTLTASKSLFTADHIEALFKISHNMPGEHTGGTYSANDTSASIHCAGGWRLSATGTSFTGSIELQYSTDNGATWKMLRKYSSIATLNASGDEDEFVLLQYVVVRSAGSIIVDLNTDPYIREGIVKVTAVTSATVATVDVIEAAAAVDATADWSEGSWSNENGYPAVVGFYQDRLCYANTYAEPQTEWSSQTGDYTNFATGVDAADGISINLPAYKVNGIRALVPMGKIVAMTSSSEWAIGPGSDGIFSPTSVQVENQGYRGTSNLQPLMIGNRLIHVLPSGATVRDLGYDYNVAGYTGDNISIFSNHLFTGHKIVDMAYQQEPDSLIWAVRDDGVLLSCTYMREQEVVAWTRHETDGLVESVCCIPGDGYDELWLCVKRGDKRFVEIMERRSISTLPAEQFYVDCGLTYRGAAADVITGLDHLEGKAVVALADGNVVRGLTVTAGAITLSTAASIVHVGLSYNSILETLNLDVPLQDGTMQGRKVQVPEVVVRYLNSRGGQVGPDENNLTEFVQRTNEPLGEPIALQTGDYTTTMFADYENCGRIMVKQSDPLPLTVLALIPKVNVGD
jgi:hypothetical protein